MAHTSWILVTLRSSSTLGFDLIGNGVRIDRRAWSVPSDHEVNGCLSPLQDARLTHCLSNI